MKRSHLALGFIAACVSTGVVIACSDRGDAYEPPTGKQASAVVQPPESQRDKCHGAPSCVLPRNEPGCRVRGECVPVCEGIVDPCNPSVCCIPGQTPGCVDGGVISSGCPFGYVFFPEHPGECCLSTDSNTCVPLTCP